MTTAHVKLVPLPKELSLQLRKTALEQWAQHAAELAAKKMRRLSA